MKANKRKIMSIIGALGLSAGTLAGCGVDSNAGKDYMKVVDKDGKTRYVDEDEYERKGGGAFFIPFAAWNGTNHSNLSPASGFSGAVHNSRPAVKSSSSSKSSSGKSGIGSGRSGTSTSSGG